MRFRLLGTVDVLDDHGRARGINSPNQRKLLAVLLARRGETVSPDVLVDALWGDDVPATARSTLRSYVSRLRRDVGDALVGRPGGYALEVGPDLLDADVFERIVRRAEQEPAQVAADSLIEALARWHGPAFGPEAGLDAVRPEAVRLDQRREAARQSLAEALLTAGRTGDAIAAAESIIAAEPTREPAWDVLIRALGASGRTAEALRAFGRAREELAEIGLEPSDALRSAEREVLAEAVEAPAAAEPRGAVPTDRPAPPTLPRRASSFVGREDEVRAVAELLDDVRVVTLVGPGGVGKTRLAMEVAHRRAPAHRHGSVWVDLEPLADGDDVGDAVVSSLAVTGGRSTGDALWFAAQLDALVVLDNAEHVLDAVCTTLAELISHGDTLRFLVTSRERVGVSGEHVRPLDPLPVAGVDSPSFRLLSERADAAGATIADTDAPGALDLLARLDGLPLAIEMAAAQLRTMSIAELLEVLDDAELSGPERGTPLRHRSLAAVLEWSERTLPEEERRLLHELSVFAGPVTTPDVVGVVSVDGAAPALRRLAERSLVAVDTGSASTTFHLLQTVRSRARLELERSGRAAGTAAAHARWYDAAAAEADGRLRSPDEGAARTRLDRIVDEMRVAQAWARVEDPELAERLAGHLYIYARTGTHDEPLLWAEALVAERGEDVVGARALVGAAARAITRSDLHTAQRLGTLAAARGDADRNASDSVTMAWELVADVHLFGGRLEAALESYQVVTDRAEDAGDDLMLVLGATGRSLAHTYGGDPDEALASVVGIPDRPDRCPTARGWIEYARGELSAEADSTAAVEHLDRSAELARSVGSRYLEGTALISATSLRSRVGPPLPAWEQFRSVIRLWNDVGERTHQLTTLRNLAVLLRRLDLPEVTAELVGSVDAADVETYGDEARRLDEVRAWIDERLGVEHAGQLRRTGASRNTFAAAEWVLAAVGL